MKLSVVTTLYKSAPYIAEFHRRAAASAREFAGDDFEIVMVNDGSPDDSLELAIAIAKADTRCTVVDLSRNFGHHKAMMEGLAQARGRHVFLIDCDLEEDPEWLAGFAAQMACENCDVVYGVQISRKGAWFERWSGALFYRIFRTLSGIALPNNVIVARLMTRRFVDALLLHEEREIFMAGLWAITGFHQAAQPVVKHQRGSSSYSVGARISQFVNSITSFSNKPLIGIFVLGCAISFLAFCFTFYLIVKWLFFLHPPEGWTSVIASVWLLGGFIMASIGLIGIYVAKVFSETKRRPNTIVRSVYGRRESGH